MGLEVATRLSHLPTWSVHILDLPTSPGATLASSSLTFHPCDVTSEAGLASIIKNIWAQEKRLDFVFANAGIAEHADFFAEADEDGDGGVSGEVKGLHALVDINVKSVVTTSWLALQYMRRSPSSDKSLVMTASCGGLYPSFYSPM